MGTKGASIDFTAVENHPLVTPLREFAADWHIVGGSLRDAALGLASTDLDVSVPNDGEDVAQQLAAQVGGRPVVLGGDRWASYRVVVEGFQADIWDRRGGSLYADQERRDLTINSIAYDPASGSILDPFDGCGDLGRRLLRATRANCFERDPLRVLRLARFRVELSDFRIDGGTRQAAREAAPALTEVASERVREELERLLSNSSLAQVFGLLSDLGALRAILPEVRESVVAEAREFEYCRQFLAARIGSAEASVDVHLLGAVGVLLRQAAVETDLQSAARGLQSRGLLSKKTLRQALNLALAVPPTTEKERRVFLARHGSEWLVAAALSLGAADSLPAAEAVLEELAGTARRQPNLVRGLTPLLDGHEVGSALGVSSGPEIGGALAKLFEAQATGAVRTRQEALELVASLTTTSPPPDAD